MKELIISRTECGGRMDKAVIHYLDKAPKNFVYKMLRKKNIVLNDRKANGSEILNEGDVIRFYLADETIQKFSSPKSQPKQVKIPTFNKRKMSFESMIIFEDENIIAVNKPSGLLSQRSDSNERCLNDMLLDYLGKDDLFTPGISNRLDRNTSGIILAGKNPRSTRLLNEAIRQRDLKKHYITIAGGQIREGMVLEGYLVKDSSSNKSIVYASRDNKNISVDKKNYIKTGYRVLSANNKCTLLDADLITGRSHQIRAQLAFAGHGIIGDLKYGNAALNEYFRKKYNITSQVLHAHEVWFEDMAGILAYLNGKKIKAALPDIFVKTIKGEGLCLPGDQGV